jgi:hypothetical protein
MRPPNVELLTIDPSLAANQKDSKILTDCVAAVNRVTSSSLWKEVVWWLAQRCAVVLKDDGFAVHVPVTLFAAVSQQLWDSITSKLQLKVIADPCDSRHVFETRADMDVIRGDEAVSQQPACTPPTHCTTS